MARQLPPFLRGRKGAKFKNTPDTIRSEDSIEVVLGVGEGKNFGLADGAKSFLVGGTALINSNDEANIGDFVLREYTGDPNPAAVVPVLGGLGSPTAANVSSLAQGVSVVRTGQLTQIDYIDLRFLVNQLLRQNDKGVYTDTMTIKVEYRQSLPAGQTWKLAWANVVPLPGGYDESLGSGGGDPNVYTGGETSDQYRDRIVTFKDDYLKILVQALEPARTPGAIWLRTTLQNRPYVQVDGEWVEAPNLQDQGDSWTYTTGGDSPTTTVFYKDIQTIPPLNPEIGAVWVPPGGQAHRFNGSSWVVPLIGSAANYGYAQPLRGDVSGVVNISEKITSPTVREVRVPVPRVDVPYEIRVTKTSADTTTDGKQVSEVGWESFEEIVAEGKTFPNTHLIHLIARAGDQFNSLPELQGDVKGLIVDVPTNYDPLTRTYNGIWDGLFKKAWSNNGAWCTRDFIKNDRYGLSTLYPLEVKESSFYAWAQWCDQPVPDNKGGSRPRWTYNDTLDQPRQAKEQANYMAGSSGGRLIDDGSGVYDVLIDRDEPLSMIFGPESIVDGEIVYSFSDIQTRANWIKVGFVNPELNWEVDFRLVKDDDHIAEHGRIPMEFVATGKTNVSEALAAARLRLITGTTEYTAATFRVTRAGKYLFPFKNIGLVDPEMGWGVSGRISEVTGPRQVRLRDSVFLEAGILYRFVFNRPTVPATTVELAVAPGQTGALKTINFTTDLPADLPEFAQFSLESYDGATGNPIGLAKAFRIITITPGDGDSDVVELTVLELNRNKTAFVDGTGELLPAEEYSNFNGPVLEPRNVRVTPTTATAGGVTRRNLQVEWDRPANPFARNTFIEYSRDGNAFNQIAESRSEFYELEDIISGTHALRLTHVSDDGLRKSKPILVVHEVTSEYRDVQVPGTAALVDEGSDNLFQSTSPKFQWLGPTVADPNFSHYKVQIYAPSIGAQAWPVMVREEDAGTEPTYTYSYDKIVTDFSVDDNVGRAFYVIPRTVDDFGNMSPLERQHIEADHPLFENLAPAEPDAVNVKQDGDGFLVSWLKPPERDYGGTKVYTALGSAPLTEAFDGRTNQVKISVDAIGVYKVRIAHYDLYNPTELVTSGTFTKEIVSLLSDLENQIEEQIAEAEGRLEDARLLLQQTLEAADAAILAAQALLAQNQATLDATLTEGLGNLETAFGGFGDQLIGLDGRIDHLESVTVGDGFVTVEQLDLLQASFDTDLTLARGRIGALETITTNGTFATSTRVNLLEANFTTDLSAATGRIGSLETITTNGTFATAQRVNLMESAFNTEFTEAKGRILTVENITTNGTFATSSRVQTLESAFNTPVTGALARIQSLETTTTNGTFATASQLNSLNTTFTGNLSTANGRIDDLNVLYSSLSESTGTRLNQLEVDFNTPTTGAKARILSLENVTTNGTFAAASRVQTLETAFNTPVTGALARIAVVENVTTNGTFAAASRVSALETNFNTPVTGAWAKIAALESITSNGTFAAASRLQTLETAFNTPTTGALARIDRLDSTLANSEFVTASQLSQVNARFDGPAGAFAKITDFAEVAARADGRASAIRSVMSDVNGVITGTESINDGVRTGFKVRADLFQIVPSGGGASFTYQNGLITITSASGAPRIQLGLFP